MAHVVAFTNQKGGVGKTSSSMNFAFHCVKQGKRVLCIDCDGQGNLSSRLAMDDNGEILPLSATRTVDLFDENVGEITPLPCPRGIDLIATEPYDLNMYELEAVPIDKVSLPAKRCRELFKSYDYVVIDCPPSLGRLLIAALTMATHAVIPVRVSGFSVDGIGGLLKTINTVQGATNPNLKVVGIFVNDFQPTSKAQQESYAELKEMAGDYMLKSALKNRPPIDTAVNRGVPLSELPYAHVADKEVAKLMDEIIERVNRG